MVTLSSAAWCIPSTSVTSKMIPHTIDRYQCSVLGIFYGTVHGDQWQHNLGAIPCKVPETQKERNAYNLEMQETKEKCLSMRASKIK